MAGSGARFPLGDLPRGFAFQGESFAGFVGKPVEPVLRICRGLPAAGGGRLFATVVLEGIPASAGTLRAALGRVVPLVAPGGALFLRVANSRAWHRIRRLLDGAGAAFAPGTAAHDPLLAVSRADLVRTLFYSGLVLEELVDVPAMQAPPGREFVAALWERDVNAAALEQEGAVECYYACVRRAEPCRGSVLVAASSPAEALPTVRHLEAVVPPGWEILPACPEPGEDPAETELWNRALPRSRGDRIWLLRAGQRPGREWLAETVDNPLCRKLVTVSPDLADLAGMLLHRRDLVECGPLPWHRRSSAVAREEFGLRLASRGRQLVCGPGPIPGAGPRPEPAAAAEAAEFLAAHEWLGRESRVVAARAAAAVRPWAGRRPTVSLCMMTRDEERFLARCLESARPAVDEIVVVDTGSQDGTVAIAQAYGARVLHEEWDDDFSAPRNTGLRACTGDWILVLDGDEELLPGAVDRIRKEVEDPTIGAYHLTFYNLDDEGRRTNGVRMVRLFRNLPGIEYRNRIHEQVVWSVLEKGRPWELAVGASEAKVVHHGYTSALLEDRGKKARNWRLFERQLAEEPRDHYSWYKFGDFLRRFGTPDQVKEKLARALEQILELPEARLREVPYASEVATLLALEEAKAGDYAKAEELLVLALDRFMPTPNTYYIAAGVAVRTDRPELALELYDECLAFRDTVLVVPVEDGLADYASWHAMGAAWSMMGQPGRARDYLEAALARRPDYLPGVLGLSSVLLKANEPARAVELLGGHLALHPECATAWEQGAAILVRLGLVGRARHWLLQARAAGPASDANRRAMGEISLLDGDLAGALREWAALAEPPFREAAIWLGRVLAGDPAGPGPGEAAGDWLRALAAQLGRIGRVEWASRLQGAFLLESEPAGMGR